MPSAEAIADPKAHDLKSRSRLDGHLLEQVRLVQEHASLSQLVAIFNAALLAYGQWAVVDHVTIVIWLSCTIGVALARVQIARFFQRAQPTSAGNWFYLVLAGVAASGLLWGAAGVLLFPQQSFAHQVFTAFVLAGMIAGAAAILSPLLIAFALFAVPPICAITLQFLLRADPMYFSMAVMTLVFAGSMAAVAKQVNASLRARMTLSERNGRLIRVLTSANAQTEVLNQSLREEVAERGQKEQALRDSQAWLAEAQRMARLGSWSYHRGTGRSVWAEETYRMYGLERATAVPSCRALLKRIHRDDRARVHMLFKRAVRHGEPFEMEFRMNGPDHAWHWIHALGQPRVDEHGATYEVRGTVVDITQRKAQEYQLDAERKVFEAMARGVPLKDVLHSLCELLESQCDSYVAIYLLQHEALVEAAAPSLPAEYRLTAARIPLGSHAGLYAGSVEQGHAVLATDIATDARWADHRQSALQAGIRACWAVPILGSSQPMLGVLATYFSARREPTAHELRLIDRVCNIAKIALERDEAEQRIRQLAHFDELTGLPNRALFNQAMEHALARAQRESRLLALLFVDVDRFKNINDTLGHDAGDRLLSQVAERLRQCVRASDLVARFGGDEFMVLLEDLDDVRDAATVAEKLLNAIAKPLALGQQEFHLSASIGISTFPDDGADPRVLQKNADIAMYRAKERGRSCWHFYSRTTDKHSLERLQLESDLRRALERDELELHYQPKQDIASGRITGIEALVRWRHPELGLLPPGRFIPLAEETGLIVALGEWVLRRAVAQNVQLQEEYVVPLTIAVNLSARQFEDEQIVELVAEVLEQSGMQASLLELEITESMVMQNAELAAHLLRRLNDMGVRLAMDDFGTGYSSLAYLKRFPVDTIKIDRSFIQGIPGDSDDATLTQAIIAMAHSLQLCTVAEGVETADQLGFLREHHCDEIQGYYFSRPLPYSELLAKLQAHSALEPADDHAAKPPPIIVWP
jgi:diguanylate cyclase (GGDEF)-like protein